MSYATEVAVQAAERNFTAPLEVYDVVTITAPCPSGHVGATWRSERIATNQGRTVFSCRDCR